MPRPRLYHRADEMTLRQWTTAGDLLAEFELIHRGVVERMVRDLTANPQTSFGPPGYVIHLSPNLALCFQKGASWVGLSLLLDEGTPKQSILDHWQEIRAWQERLERWQGAWDAEVRYVAPIARWHAVWDTRMGNTDPSYADLAQWVNREIAWYLAGFVVTLQLELHPDHPPAIEPLLEQPSWRVPPDHWASDLFQAVRIMEVWGMSPGAIREYCIRAFDTLTEAWTAVRQEAENAVNTKEQSRTPDGWCQTLLTYVTDHPPRDNPIGPDEPIDRDRIIGKLRQLRRQRPPLYPPQ